MKHDNLGYALDRLESRLDRLDTSATETQDFRRYRDDPVGFVRDVLGGESATRRTDGEPYQFTMLERIATHEQTTFCSGHGVGKSTVIAWAALWWMASRGDALVALVAPTAQRQGRGIIVREILKWARRASLSLRTDGTGLHFDATGGRVIVLSGSADVAALEGFHSPATLLVADEAKGLDRLTLDGLAGTLTGGEGREFYASTPGSPSGPFFDATQSPDWQHVHVGSDDSSLVSPRWVAGRARAWGVQSPTYTMRVRGLFPADGAGQVFSWALLYSSVGRELAPSVKATIAGCSLGLDIARSIAGDASAAIVLRDGQIVHRETWRFPDLTQTTTKAMSIAARFRPDRITIDAGGLGGGVADRLRELGATVRDVMFGARADDPDRFVNRRAEMFWTLRERLECGSLSLPSDDDLLAELAAQRLMFDAKGRIQLAPKDLVRADIGRSPDLGDALALACCPSDPNEWYPDYSETFSIGGRTFYAGGSSLAERLGLATE